MNTPTLPRVQLPSRPEFSNLLRNLRRDRIKTMLSKVGKTNATDADCILAETTATSTYQQVPLINPLYSNQQNTILYYIDQGRNIAPLDACRLIAATTLVFVWFVYLNRTDRE